MKAAESGQNERMGNERKGLEMKLQSKFEIRETDFV